MQTAKCVVAMGKNQINPLRRNGEYAMSSRVIKTMETHPNHETIGKIFKAWNGEKYLCDSWEENLGFWMTRVDAPDDRKADKHSEYRRNVSERAIGRTFHEVYNYGPKGL